MKKALKMMAMLLCVAAVATVLSCSKDNEDLIIGKWEVVKCTENGTEHSSHIGEVWEFKADGVLSCNGDNVSYTVSGNNIVIMGGMMSGTITTLTKSKLVLELSNALNSSQTRHYEFKKK